MSTIASSKKVVAMKIAPTVSGVWLPLYHHSAVLNDSGNYDEPTKRGLQAVRIADIFTTERGTMKVITELAVHHSQFALERPTFCLGM